MRQNELFTQIIIFTAIISSSIANATTVSADKGQYEAIVGKAGKDETARAE